LLHPAPSISSNSQTKPAVRDEKICCNIIEKLIVISEKNTKNLFCLMWMPDMQIWMAIRWQAEQLKREVCAVNKKQIDT